MSPKTWRLSDLGAKHAFLRAALGWGGMPHHLVEADLATGTLVPLKLAEFGRADLHLHVGDLSNGHAARSRGALADRSAEAIRRGHTNFGSEPLSSRFAKAGAAGAAVCEEAG